MPAIRGKNTHKICLVGNSTVGKSCIATRLVHDTFSEQTNMTIGSAYSHKELSVDGETYDLNVWDTAGQERFRALAPLYYRDASAIVLVYDITNEKSFECLRTTWVPALRACTKSDLALAVVGNKLDLEDRGRIIPAEEGRGYAELLGAAFMECSAKTGKNVERVFAETVRKIRGMQTPAAAAEAERPTSVIRLPGSATTPSETIPSQSPTNHRGAPNGTPGTEPQKPKSSCKCN